jgi:hypothetical protein
MSKYDRTHQHYAQGPDTYRPITGTPGVLWKGPTALGTQLGSVKVMSHARLSDSEQNGRMDGRSAIIYS